MKGLFDAIRNPTAHVPPESGPVSEAHATDLLHGRLVPTVGARGVVTAGAVCGTLAYTAPALWHDGVGEVAATKTLLGLGIGLSIAEIATLVVASVEPAAASGAVGVNALVRTIGAALGAQVAAAIITAGLVQGP